MKIEILILIVLLVLLAILVLCGYLVYYKFKYNKQFKPNKPKPDSFYITAEMNQSLKKTPYVRKELLQQVIRLFRDYPFYRDNRLDTVEWIFKNYYKSWVNINNIKTVAVILYDIDRAFRLIQQHAPELRGKQWRARQKQGGRKFAEYDKDKNYDAEIEEVCNQLSLTFTD
jgi:hypothetical protein